MSIYTCNHYDTCVGQQAYSIKVYKDTLKRSNQGSGITNQYL